MDYQQTIDYLYHAAPLFQNIGAGAYKEGLETTRTLDAHFQHPHTRYRTIHVAGTNGKGSVSSSLAAVLQAAGYRVGLYTSPHLVDFRERVRVGGEMIPEQRVVDFVEQERPFFEPLHPSFFELTTALAFLYFAEQQVDVAVVEVGLGGRLDCTNIIRPDLSVITNISFDHQQFLGNTLAAIAAEKAGIIKAGVPVVIGETGGNADVRQVFVRTAAAVGASTIRFADEDTQVPAETLLNFQLRGEYQRANLRTILCALSELRKQPYYASRLSEEAVSDGFSHVMELTGLRGRWQQLRERPVLVCDAGHNVAGLQCVVHQLSEQETPQLHVLFGMVGDKDYDQAAQLFARLAADRHGRGLQTSFYLTQPSCARALSVDTLAATFRQHLSVCGDVPRLQTFSSVGEALSAALTAAAASDFVFVGGSCYVVADLFSIIE